MKSETKGLLIIQKSRVAQGILFNFERINYDYNVPALAGIALGDRNFL